MSRFSKHIEKLNRVIAEDPKSGEFADQVQEVVLSNLYRLFPGASLAEMRQMSREAYFNQSRASIEVGYFSELVPQITLTDRSAFPWTSSPAVFVSYHIAGYRLLPAWLLHQGLKLTIVMDKSVAEHKEEKFSGALGAFLTKAGMANDTFRFRDTSDPSLVLKLVRDLKSGSSVLFYIDGNMGIDGKKPSEQHSLAVPFMDHQLHSRTGIPVIAHLAHAPVIPAMMSQSSELTKNRVELFPAIIPSGDRQEFVAKALTEVWGHCEDRVRTNPGLWESLRYVNKYVAYRTAAPSQSKPLGERDEVIFNYRRFAFRDDFDETVVFDRQEALLFTIGPKVTPFLKTLYEKQEPARLDELKIPDYVGKWLHQKEILRVA